MTEHTEHAGCRICESGALHEIDEFRRLKRVTSDCRPWPSGGRLQVCKACGAVQKPGDRRFSEDARAIYDAYSVYYQSGGEEQKVFAPAGGAVWSRSEKLLKELSTQIDVPAKGKLLDIGCGNGNLLRSFGRRFPGWALFGSELSDKHRAEVEAIDHVTGFFSGDITAIDDTFDIITMVHCLEHIESPRAFLETVRRLLRPEGMLILEIPDFQNNPFDLVIADHCLHFDPETIGLLAAACGFETLMCRRDVIPKEMSAVLRPVSTGAIVRRPPPKAAVNIQSVERAVAWLFENLRRAGRLAGGTQFGLFGTSIAAIWLFGAIGDDVNFFIDEDENRVGRLLENRPIRHPREVAPDQDVYLALVPAIADKVKERLGHGLGTYHLPPALDMI